MKNLKPSIPSMVSHLDFPRYLDLIIGKICYRTSNLNELPILHRQLQYLLDTIIKIVVICHKTPHSLKY